LAFITKVKGRLDKHIAFGSVQRTKNNSKKIPEKRFLSRLDKRRPYSLKRTNEIGIIHKNGQKGAKSAV